MSIKDKIKYLRENKGWTITTLAKKAGVAVTTISQIEEGRSNPSIRVLEKIATTLEVSADYLIGIDKKTTLALEIKDKELFEQFRQIEQLSGEDRKTVKAFLRLFLSRKPAKKS